MTSPTPASAYEQLGASASKEDVHAAVAGADPGLFPSAFCRLGPDVLTGDPEWCAALHADGAGTKALVAYLHYRETGDPTVFRSIAHDALVMNLDDLACVGAVDGFLLVNTIGRNSRHIPGAVLQELTGGFAAVIEMLKRHDVHVIATGGETADLNDSVRTIVVDAAMAARVRRTLVVDAGRIAPGDAIIGLSSTGKAAYEERPNSGIGANGLTLARHALLSHYYFDAYPETVAPELDLALLYRGGFKLDDRLEAMETTVGEALLSPTRTYTPILRRVVREFGSEIHGLIHNTGGGLCKCLRFGRNIAYVKDDLFPIPLIFRLIAEAGKVAWWEMVRTYNMGHRLEIMTPPANADRIIQIAGELGVEGRIVGRCERGDGQNSLTVVGEFGTLEYH